MADTITDAEKEFPSDLLETVYGFQNSQVNKPTTPTCIM